MISVFLNLFPIDNSLFKVKDTIPYEKLIAAYRRDSLAAAHRSDSLVRSIDAKCDELLRQQKMLKKQQDIIMATAKNKQNGGKYH